MNFNESMKYSKVEEYIKNMMVLKRYNELTPKEELIVALFHLYDSFDISRKTMVDTIYNFILGEEDIKLVRKGGEKKYE